MNNHVGQQLGNYRLLHLLGQGGFAEVYLAEHIHLKAPAAVKLLYGKLTTQGVQAFVQEAQTIAALKHPCILRVLEFGFEQTRPFLVMDYAAGGTLRDRHPESSLVALTTVIPYVQQMAAALAYAHTSKLIHRDVKPENMLIDTDGKILLSDFGIAATAHNTSSMKTLDNTGTVPYMAPEQIKGKPRPASDQYALAIVVYEWLCGERPFTGDSPIEIAMKHLSEKPPSFQAKGIALPSKVEHVVLRALAKEPQQRFPDILTFAHALEQAGQSTRKNIFTTLSFFPQLQKLVPTQPALVSPQKQRLTLTQPAPSPLLPFSPQASFSGVSAEEEMLLTYIHSLALSSIQSEANTHLEVLLALISEHAKFFQRQPDCRKRVVDAFDGAIAQCSQNAWRSIGRNALTTGKAEFLRLFTIHRIS